MGVPDFDERSNRLDISRYAPPQYRRPAGAASVGPVLERLSRGISDRDQDSTAAQPVPPAEPIQIQQVQDRPPAPKIPAPMTGRLAVAIGLVAALAVVSVAFLRSRAEHSVSAASAESPKTAETIGMRDLPKPVRTVTMRREPATVGDAQASAVTGASARPLTQNVASVAERIDAVAMKPAQPRVENALALTAPLKMWAMFPAEPSAGEQDAATAPAEADDGKAAKDVTPKRAAVRHQRAKAANRARRRRYTRRRRARTAATRPQPAQQAAVPAETQTNADQPVRKLPLQAAIDAIFGNGGDSGDVTSAGTMPATTGAAFQ